MQKSISTQAYRSSIRDFAIDGLLRGLVSGGVMLLYLIVVGLFINESPAAILGRFGPDGGSTPLLGFASHMGMSAIYGAVFMVLLTMIRQQFPGVPPVAAGVAYAIALFIIAEVVLLPAVQSPMLGIPAIHFGIGHVIYGFVLGYLTERK